MSIATLEHVNLTVSEPDETAALLGRIFGWKVRWTGGSIHDGYTVHVGSDSDYLALYKSGRAASNAPESYFSIAGLNHVGVVVADLDATEAKVVSEGLVTFNHQDYEPGRRFYFRTSDNVEIEVISYPA